MHTNIINLLSKRNLQIATFSIMCVVGSFMIGIRTAGEVQPVSRSVAQQANILKNATTIPGDIDGNGAIDVRDAIDLLEIIQGYKPATVQAQDADPNQDQTLDTDDVLRILRTIALR